MKKQAIKNEKQAARERIYSFSRRAPFYTLNLFLVCGLIICAAVNFAAQTVSGTVLNSRNAPVENATVTLTNRNKIISQTKTGVDGKFSIDANEQILTLKIEADGFAIYEKLLTEIEAKSNLSIVLGSQNLRENVTVSITRTVSRLNETPASIVVLNEQTLKTTAAQTTDDALRQIAGFTLFRRGSSKTSNPTTQGANLRGLSGSGAARTAVLLDGLSLNDAFGGWTFWSRVPSVGIERAEVLRGGASVFDGDTALSGAVNLISKHAENTPIFQFETSAGSQKTFDGGIFTSFGKNGWNVDLTLEQFQTAGYVPTAVSERGQIDTKANSRHQNGFLTLEKVFSSSNSDFRPPRIFVKSNIFSEQRDNGTSLTNNRAYFRQISFGADYENEKLGTFQLRAFAEKQIYDQTFSAISSNRNAETLSRIQRVPSQAFGANLFWSKTLGLKHIIGVSGETREVRGFSNETAYGNNTAVSLIGAGGTEKTFAVFAQDFWRVTKKLNINFGGRFDFWQNINALSSTKTLAADQTTTFNFPNRNQQNFSPRIAAIYQLNRNFSALATFTKSFRAPTLNELYRAFRVGNVLTLANENLRAERADTFETGLNFVGWRQKLNLRGNIFVTEIARPVVSVTLSADANLITRQRQNVGQTRSRGIEFDAEFAPISNLKLTTGFLAVDSRVSDFVSNSQLIGKFLPQVARRQLTFQGVYKPQSKLTLSAQGRISSAQFEDDLNALKLRPFSTFDVFAAYDVSRKIQLFAASENILNNRYDIGLTPNLTVAAPRFLRIGLRFNLKNN